MAPLLIRSDHNTSIVNEKNGAPFQIRRKPIASSPLESGLETSPCPSHYAEAVSVLKNVVSTYPSHHCAPTTTTPTANEISVMTPSDSNLLVEQTRDLSLISLGEDQRPKLAVRTIATSSPFVTNDGTYPQYNDQINTPPFNLQNDIRQSPSSLTERDIPPPPPPPPTTTAAAVAPEGAVNTAAKPSSAYIQKAYEETRHFLGGLIEHPTESTKHFTILRHSHGIVFYKGSHTFFTISIFADAPLPLDRTLWLQNRGWTGNTGMKTKALFHLNDSWLNVTPAMVIQPDQVPVTDERAWQRDIAKFREKASVKIRDRHLLRETCIVRIPVEADDGYFQILLSQGDTKKKVLCRSPVFRVMSTSSDMSSLRGASLKTLPLELGAYVASLHAKSAVSTVLSPITSSVQSFVQPYMPSQAVRTAASTGWSVSGIQDQLGNETADANDRFAQFEDRMYSRAGGEDIDLAQGPQPPYPIAFKAQPAGGLEASLPWTGTRSQPLSKVPPEIPQRLHGYYLGWCRFSDLFKQHSSVDRLIGREKERRPTEIFHMSSTQTPTTAKSHDANNEEDLASLSSYSSASYSFSSWHQVVISSLTLGETKIVNVKAASAFTPRISIRFVDDVDLEDDSFLQREPGSIVVEIQVMGFIRPQPSSPSSSPFPSGSPSSPLSTPISTSLSSPQQIPTPTDHDKAEETLMLEACDTSITKSILYHPAWTPDRETSPQESLTTSRGGAGSIDLSPTSTSTSASTPTSLSTTTSDLLDRTKDKYVKLRMSGEKVVGRVPVHKLGVRGPMDVSQDQATAPVNGFYIVRDTINRRATGN
jgi:hypothetical protein